MSEKYPNLQRTNLAWDPYMRYLVFAIDEANYMKRAQAKPMMTPRHAEESHLTSRAMHLRETADIAKRIAVELGLNDDLAYIGMLLHDAGHPFSAHEGEVIFNELNETFDGQYFHHNSKGLDVIKQEGILDDAIKRIPNLTPELEAKLRHEFNYFLDIVISHDGEASEEDLKQQNEKSPYSTVEEAIIDKGNKANSSNKYKFIAETPEGQVAKYSDAIAYLATDIQDAFRMGFLKQFDSEYLELIGTMILKNREYTTGSETKEYTKEEKIRAAKEEIDLIKESKLREQFKDVNTDKNRPLINAARTIKEEIDKLQAPRIEAVENQIAEEINKREEEQQRKLDDQEKKDIRKEIIKNNKTITDKEIEAEIEKELMKYEKERINGKLSLEEILKLESEEEKIKEFTYKLLNIPSDVVQSITQQMQEFFINDILHNSKPKENGSNNMPAFSNEGLQLLIDLKRKNMREFVIDTKWDYQQKLYPGVAQKMVNTYAQNIIKAGTIRNKFYDPDIRGYIEDEEALKHMKVQFNENDIVESKKYKRRIGLRQTAYTVPSSEKSKITENRLTCKLIRHVEEKGESFASQYMYTYNAIPTRVRNKVARAFLQKKEDKPNAFYEDVIQEELKDIRDAFLTRHGKKVSDKPYTEDEIKSMTADYNAIPKEEKEAFVQELIEQKRQNMELIMAKQMVSDYLAGMTDESFKHIAINLKLIDRKTIEEAERGTTKSASVVGHLRNLSKGKQEHGAASKDVGER